MRELGVGHRQAGQLGGHRLGQPLAALVRALVSSVAAADDFGLELVDAAFQSGERLLGDVELRQPFARLARPTASTPSMSAAYLRVSVRSSPCRASLVSKVLASLGNSAR